MKLFDSHVHLQLLNEPLLSAFTPALVPAVAEEDWLPLLRNYAGVDNLWLALGVHPQYAHQWHAQSLLILRQLCAHPRVVAIGEVGLDRHITSADQSLQRQVLGAQIRLAVELNKPLILHCYKQYAALIEILHNCQATGSAGVGGIVHGFSGSPELALRLWKMGFALGIGRVVLNDRARRLRATVEQLPAAAIVLETDAPWPLKSGGGGENGVGSLGRIAERVAALRGQTLAEVAAMNSTNLYRILKLT